MNTMEYDELRRSIYYCPLTGIFIWRDVSKYHRQLKNKEAGYIQNSRGKKYLKIKINGIHYAAHRLAWCYIYKKWPLGIIDHINGNSLDNRISNLRDVGHAENAQNHLYRKSLNGLPMGVRKYRNRYVARIRVNGNEIYLGTFDTIHLAEQAYISARKELHDSPIIA